MIAGDGVFDGLKPARTSTLAVGGQARQVAQEQQQRPLDGEVGNSVRLANFGAEPRCPVDERTASDEHGCGREQIGIRVEVRESARRELDVEPASRREESMAVVFVGRRVQEALRPELTRTAFDLLARVALWDDVLDYASLYWFTNTSVSSAQLYWESKLAFFAPKGVPIPMAYPKLVHDNKMPKGGHFAAWELPDYFVSEMRATFKALR